MTGIPTNIEKGKISQGETGNAEAFEAGQAQAAEVLRTPEIRDDQTTREAIREQLAKPGESVISEDFREQVMEPIAGNEPVSFLSPQKKLEDFIEKGLRADGFNAFDLTEGINVEVEKHRKDDSKPSLN